MIFMSGMAVGLMLCFISLYALAVLRRRRLGQTRGTDEKVRMGEQVIAVVGHGDGQKTIIEGGS